MTHERYLRLCKLLVLCIAVATTFAQSNRASAASNYDLQSAIDDTTMYDPTTYGCTDGSSGAGGSVPLTGSNNVEKTMNFFVGKGLSAMQAAAIVGNLEQESGQGIDPKSVQPGGPGRGSAQWSVGGRWDIQQGDNLVTFYIPKYAAGTSEWDLGVQLNFIWYELNNFPVYEFGPFKAATTLADATSIFEAKFEIAGIAALSNRINYATTAYNMYRQVHGGGGAITGSGSCGTVIAGNCTVSKPVYTGQYSIPQLAAIFGDPGTAASHPALHLVTAKEWGFSTEVSPLVLACLQATVQQIQAQNINYKVKEFGCYRFDSNNGSSNIGLASYHTYGAACDINWDTNPFVASGAPTAHDMPQAYVKAFNDHGFTWGGSWTSPKDYMHFEWHGVVPK